MPIHRRFRWRRTPVQARASTKPGKKCSPLGNDRLALEIAAQDTETVHRLLQLFQVGLELVHRVHVQPQLVDCRDEELFGERNSLRFGRKDLGRDEGDAKGTEGLF